MNLCYIKASNVMFFFNHERAILSVHKGCGSGSMIVFTPDGKCKMVNDKKCIEQVQQIIETTPGFDIVYDRGTYVF